MENQETDSAPKRRLQKKSGKIFVLPLFLLVLFLFGAYFLFFSESAQKLRPEPSLPAPGKETISLTNPGNGSLQQHSTLQISAEKTNNVNIPAITPSVSAITDKIETPLAKSSENTPSNSTESRPVGPNLSEECLQLADSVEQFFDMIDTRDYMQQFEIDVKSSVYLPKLIQKLVDNPPIVSGETDDLFTILKNTAHFFRIIGKKNIFILKGILDREKSTFEQTLSDFYELTNQAKCLKERFGLTIEKEPLYQYAGFFINTMGGRLYLFRRDSMSRMVVNYYAILLIDQANREGRNKYGVEINSTIDILIDEIESSNIKLQMRERYLDKLYSLKEKYQ